MMFLFELLPVLAFFITYQLAGAYMATITTMSIMTIQIFMQWIGRKPISFMQGFSFLLVILMGFATLFSKNLLFIQWKPTLLCWMFSLVCLLSPYFKNKIPFSKVILGKVLHLSDGIWRRLNYYWMLFFIGLGGMNLIIVYQYNMQTWVTFKLFGLPGLTLLFIIMQIFYFSRFINTKKLS
jgi:intracellular septation protein